MEDKPSATSDEEAANTEGVGQLLSVGERISKGASTSWVNPAYWNRQFVTASHITNNVPPDSNVLELGKDAKKALPEARRSLFLLARKAPAYQFPNLEVAARTLLLQLDIDALQGRVRRRTPYVHAARPSRRA